jgi:hypothetical protein
MRKTTNDDGVVVFEGSRSRPKAARRRDKTAAHHARRQRNFEVVDKQAERTFRQCRKKRKSGMYRQANGIAKKLLNVMRRAGY